MSESNQDKSRRNFIKKSVVGLAGATILPSVIKGEEKEASSPNVMGKKYKIVHRTLGKTGIKLPVVSMGVMNADNPKLVEAALDAGIVHLDTAWYYQRGRNEEMVGQVVKGRPRDSFVVATKIWEPSDRESGLYPKDAKAETFLEKFETSMKRLGLEYVDILYLHNVRRVEAMLFEPYVKAMQQLKKQGRIRHIGVSTHSNEPEIIRAAADSGVYEVVLTAYNYRQLHFKEVEKAAGYAAGKGLGIVGMKAIAGRPDYIGGRRQAADAKIALKWALQDENFHTNIAGFTTFDQLYDDLSIMENLALSPAEVAALEKDKQLASHYCQQCRVCQGQCRQGVDIPDMMRSYMYAYGYRNMTAARETMDLVDTKTLPCKDCKVCTVTCAVGFNVKEKILDIARIKDVPQEFLV